MYEIDIYNRGTKTVIHFPAPSSPHVINPVLTQKRGQASSLSFSMFIGSVGYDSIKRFTTLITVTDTRNNIEVFSGRIYSVKTSMVADGKIKKDIICESEMNYLQDTVVDSVIYEDKTVQQMLQTFLDAHNAKVEDYKKIYLGNVTVADWISCTTTLETTLEAIQKYVVDSNKGYLQLRKVNGSKFLDYISAESSTVVDVKLGINMKELIVSDEQAFGSRIIPVGANDLTIESVNGGKNYIEDAEAVAKYGIIYKTVDYKDIDDDSVLMTQCQNDLSNYTKPTTVLDVTALDLNKLTDTTVIEPYSMDIGVTIHIVNKILGIDENYRIYEMDLSLDKPWNPKLVISNKPVTLTSQINNLQATTIRNDGTYSGVQVGSSFGLRVMGKSNKFTVNGDTFELVRISDDKKLIYTDKDTGNIFLQDVIANKGTYNNIVAKEMQTANDSGETIKFHDKYFEIYNNSTKMMSLGYFSSPEGGAHSMIEMPDGYIVSEGTDLAIRAHENRELNLSGYYIVLDSVADVVLNAADGHGVEANGSSFTFNSQNIATQNWVTDKEYLVSSDLNNYINKSGDRVNLPNGMYIICSGEQIDFYSSDGTKIFGANKTSIAGHIPAGGNYQSVQS